MQIIKPNENYFDEYLKACKESFDNNIDDWKPFNPDLYEQWKSHILNVYSDYENGVNIH